MEVRDDEAVEHVLEWYERDPGEALVGDEVLAGVALDTLRELMSVPDNDPEMLDAYEVEPAEVEALQALVAHRIDLDAHDYFVAAYRSEA